MSSALHPQSSAARPPESSAGAILVTGGAGFIGSHVAEALLKRGDTVIAVDNLNSFYDPAVKRRNVELLQGYPGFSFEELELADDGAVQKLFGRHRITRVAHIAARAGVRPSIQDPLLYEQANVRGTLTLLQASARGDVENFVLTSSSSVYGNSRSVPFREDDSATDRPISPYAATKKATEVLGYTFHHLYKLNVNVVRPFTVYGPRGRPDMAPWLFLEAAVRGTAIKKFGDGTTRRDYTFIDDFVGGFIGALDRPLGYEIFNLGNSATVSLNECIATVEAVAGKELQIEQLPMQPGDVEITNADITKACRLLGYAPKTSFRQGMQIFHDWYCRIFCAGAPA